MNKKILITSIIIAIVVISLGFYFIKYSLDPFGAPPKGTSPNCGPENRYKFDVTINSKDDFVNFLKQKELSDELGWQFKLDNFKNIQQGMNRTEYETAQVDWSKVLSEVKTENAGLKTIYVLKYNPITCSGYTIKMTTDGHVSIYGCCGI